MRILILKGKYVNSVYEVERFDGSLYKVELSPSTYYYFKAGQVRVLPELTCTVCDRRILEGQQLKALHKGKWSDSFELRVQYLNLYALSPDHIKRRHTECE